MLSCFSHVQLCVTLWTSLPGSSVHEILQASILEWVQNGEHVYARGRFMLMCGRTNTIW